MRFNIFVLILLLFIPFVSSAPPFLVDDVVVGEGFSIVYNNQFFYGVGNNYSFCWLSLNASNGLSVGNSSVDCSFRLCDVSDCLFDGSASWDGSKWYYDVNDSVLSVGSYNFYIYCNNSLLGGGVLHNFYVTNTGEPMIGYEVLLAFALSLFPLFLSWLFIKWASILGEAHSVFKLFLSFGSLFLVLVSGWFLSSAFSRFVFWVDGVDALSVFVQIFGYLLFAIVGYWFVFMIYKIFTGIKADKAGDDFEY